MRMGFDLIGPTEADDRTVDRWGTGCRGDSNGARGGVAALGDCLQALDQLKV